MEGIDLNFGALLACILNKKLSSNSALKIMGISDGWITKKKKADDYAIKISEKENIRAIYNKGATMKQLAKIYDTNIQEISRFMINNGIQSRGRGKRKEGAQTWQSC